MDLDAANRHLRSKGTIAYPRRRNWATLTVMGEVVRAGGPGDSADYIGGMYVMEFRGA
jgi:hypothetical protein